MSYGVPPAGVLCLELIKQSQSTPSQRRLPRSEMIQNLSVFTTFLDWISPAGGNYQLCQRVKKIISRVLDEVLEGPSHTQRISTDLQATYNFELPNDLSGWQGVGDVNLWDSLEWADVQWDTNNPM